MSNRRKLPKPRQRICRQCAAGSHTGHGHAVCPHCEGRIEPGRVHGHVIDGRWVTFSAEAPRDR